MNPSFSPPWETIHEAMPVPTYPVSPEEPASNVVTAQFWQDASIISLELGATPNHSTLYLLGVSLDDAGSVLIREPLKVFICEDEAGVHAENEELSVFAYGQTIADAINDFVAALSATWEGLKDLPESDLTVDAADLRKRLLAYIKVA